MHEAALDLLVAQVPVDAELANWSLKLEQHDLPTLVLVKEVELDLVVPLAVQSLGALADLLA